MWAFPKYSKDTEHSCFPKASGTDAAPPFCCCQTHLPGYGDINGADGCMAGLPAAGQAPRKQLPAPGDQQGVVAATVDHRWGPILLCLKGACQQSGAVTTGEVLTTAQWRANHSSTCCSHGWDVYKGGSQGRHEFDQATHLRKAFSSITPCRRRHPCRSTWQAYCRPRTGCCPAAHESLYHEAQRL